MRAPNCPPADSSAFQPRGGIRNGLPPAVLSELTAALRLRTRWQAVMFNNLPANVVPAAAAALVFDAIAASPSTSVTFYVAVAVASVIAIALSFAIVAVLGRVFFPDLEQ